ncbi:hypothetical protein [Ferrimonas balearica]|uniref:hypothetical protein n=1 Tax=Ferrimonas balearica TaxID=44012 RepID=UPI001C99B084|nr:hypothetical protein [Ferrimonas balearica]MBY5991096.1 hypothetical protein [Ferrimonas balearica]
MNTTLTVLALASAALPALAADLNCPKVGDAARSIMEHRQQGTPLSEMMTRARGDELVEILTLGAYELPRSTILSVQETYVAYFQNEMLLECYRFIRQ